MTRHTHAFRLLSAVVLGAALVGCDCGAPGVEDAGRDSGIPPRQDAGFDAGTDEDAGIDAGELDAGLPDAGEDAGIDAGQIDAGHLDAGALSCNSCHGGPDNAAPPFDTDGGFSTALITVGAHQSHLRGSAWHRNVQCEDCHVVPQTIEDPGHIDPSPAELTFGPVATSHNVLAAFTGQTCTTWCHGAALPGGSNTAPQWTRVDSTQAYCGTCHAVPPPPPHPVVTGSNCGVCHPNAAPNFNFSDPQRHIDGVVDVNLSCTGCHGSTNPAPPRDLLGNTDTTFRGVGAHQSHLADAGWHRQVQCTDCHVVPSHVEDPGHLDVAPADLTWGSVPRASGAAPAFDGGTCTNYCHGATLSGPMTTPTWTRVDGTQAACGTTCHGLPPATGHPQQSDCSRCHPTIATNLAFTAPERHIDGVLDVNVACDSCHGSNGNPAPPRDLTGNTSTTFRGVGAHRSHLGTSSWHAEVTCDDCHIVPVSVGEPTHIDTLPADITWGSTALTRNANPNWNGTTCSGVYCHGGAFDGGMGANTTPQWNRVDGTQAACGNCHGLPPGGGHPNNNQCSICHGVVIAPDGGFIAPNLHIDGLVEADVQCGSCHALPPPTGAHLKHAGLAAPIYGGLGTAAGLPAPTGYAFGCGHCHPMNSALHQSGGRADIELANAAAPVGSLKSLSPQGQYTPGSTVYVDGTGLSYTLGTCGNVYCHSVSDWTTPSGVPQPGVDFPFVGYPIVYPPYSLVESRRFTSVQWGAANPGCGGCHGLPIRTTSPQVAAMAGQSHSYIDSAGDESGHAWNHGYTPLSCRTCHSRTVTQANATSRSNGVSQYGPVPIANFALHVNGRPDVVFDTVNSLPYPSPKNLSTASYNQSTKTCSNVACHFAQTAVRSGTPYRYGVTAECNVCHQY